MSLDRLRYEVKILGFWMLATPVLVVLGTGAVTLAIARLTTHSDAGTLARLLTANIEMLLPLAVGMVAATLCPQDAAQELQLTLPRRFGDTTLVHLGLVVAWGGCIAFCAFVITYHLRLWRIPQPLQMPGVLQQVALGQLTWLSPMLWFAAFGLGLALITHSRAASVAILGGVWVFETLAYGWFIYKDWLHPFFLFPTTITPYVSFWLANRFELIGMALALLVICWLLLRNSEALIRASSGGEG